MEGGSAEKQKTEEYLANYLKAGGEIKTETAPVEVTPAEVARAAVVEAIGKVELPTTRDIDKILEKVEVAPAPKIEETPTDDGAVILEEHATEAPVMTVAPQPEMMEQPQQPWQGNSRNDQMRKWGEVADKVTKGGRPQQKGIDEMGEINTGTPEVPTAPAVESVPQPTVEVTPVQAEVAPVATTPVVEAVPEAVVPAQEKVAPIISVPKTESSETVAVKVTSKIEDGEVKGWTLTAEKKPEVKPVKAPSRFSPKEVEAALAAGRTLVVPETPKQEPAPVVEQAPAAEAPKETPLVVETLKTPVVESAPKIASDDTKPEDLPVNAKNVAKAFGYMTRRSGEALASAMTGNEVRFQRHRWEREMEGVFQYAREKNLEDFDRLGSAGKRFVRSLYTSQPANAVRALGWRMSIEFNERIANYLGEKALVAGGRGELNEAELARTEKKHTAQKEELDTVAKRFGGVTPEIAKQIEAEEKARALETKGHKGAAESSRKEEQRFKGRENTFLERRNAAAEKLAAYVEKRLAPYEAKVEAIRTTKEKLDDEIGTFKEMRDKRQIERDRLIAEVAGMNLAAKPTSIRMFYANAVKQYEEELANAGELLDMKTAQRARVELQLADMNAQADKLRPKLSAIKEIPNRAKVSDRERAKVELPADPVDAEPSLEEALEVELPEARREKLPDMTPEDFIQKWNKFAGGDIPMDVGEFVAFMGVEKDAVTPVAVLQLKISGLFEAMLHDKGKRKRLREGVTREYIYAHLRSFIKTYLPMEAKRT